MTTFNSKTLAFCKDVEPTFPIEITKLSSVNDAYRNYKVVSDFADAKSKLSWHHEADIQFVEYDLGTHGKSVRIIATYRERTSNSFLSLVTNWGAGFQQLDSMKKGWDIDRAKSMFIEMVSMMMTTFEITSPNVFVVPVSPVERVKLPSVRVEPMMTRSRTAKRQT
jgi:hypothetical protein